MLSTGFRLESHTRMNKSQRILQFIIEYSQRYPNNFPTLREICEGADISSTSMVSKHLDNLVEAGQLTKTYAPGRKTRIICVTGGRWVGPEQVANHRSFFDRYFDGFEL